MKKKIASVFMASTIFAGMLAGCGTAKDSSGGSESDTFKLGVNMELSGNVASYGGSMAKGVEMAADEINKTGGIDGKRLYTNESR